MDILGQLEAQCLEQLNVEGEAGQPFVTPHHMGGAHQMVVYCMGEMIGGDAVGFQQHLVDVIFGDGEFAFHQVVEFELTGHVTGGAEPQYPGLPGGELRLNVFHGAVTPDGVGTVVAGGFLVRLLLFPHGGQFLFRAEAGIGFSFFYQLLGVHMVDTGALTLTVGAIAAVVAIDGGTLVKVDAIVLQRFNQNLHCTGNLPLCIGVLHPQEQHAAALVCHTFTGQTLHQIAQMDKAGGGGSHTGDNSPFGHISGGIFFFQLLAGGGDIGEQKRC